MTALDRVIPTPALVEMDEIDLAATPCTCLGAREARRPR